MGDCFQLIFDGSVEGRYESNIFRYGEKARATSSPRARLGKESDFIFILTPGAELLLGNDKTFATAKFVYHEDFYFFADNSILDRQLGNGSANFAMSGDCWTLNPYAKYMQLGFQTPWAALPDEQLWRANVAVAGFVGTYSLNNKSTLASGFQYIDFSARNGRPTVRNWSQVKVPLTLFYQVCPKFEIGPTSYYQHFDVGHGGATTSGAHMKAFNSNNFFAGVAMKGQLCQKMTYDVALGTMHAHVQEQHHRTTLGGHAHLNFQTSKKVSVGIGLNREYKVHPFDAMFIESSAKIDVNYAFCPDWNLYLGTTFAHQDFLTPPSYANTPLLRPVGMVDRVDDYWTAKGVLSYKVWDCLTLLGGYEYYSVENPSVIFDFNTHNNTAFIKAHIRY